MCDRSTLTVDGNVRIGREFEPRRVHCILYFICIHNTRFPSGTCLEEWRKNELQNIHHAILHHTRMTSCYDVMKYLCCSTCGSMHVSHSSSRDPQAYRSQGPVTKATTKEATVIQRGQTTACVWCCFLLCGQAAGGYSVASAGCSTHPALLVCCLLSVVSGLRT